MAAVYGRSMAIGGEEGTRGYKRDVEGIEGCVSSCCRVVWAGCVQEYLMGWWSGFQDPSMALVRLMWGCAALGKRWPSVVPQQLAGP